MSASILQSKSGTSTLTISITVTYGSNVSSGTKLVSAVALSGSGNMASVKDGAANSETKISSIAGTTGGAVEASTWAMDTPAGDVGTTPAMVTATVGGGNKDWGMEIFEISGLAVGNTLGAMVDGTPGTSQGNTYPASASYTSAAAGEFLWYQYCDNGGPANVGTPSGYTLDTNGLNNNSTADVQVATKNSTGGAESGSWSLSSGTATGHGVILFAFLLSGATTTITASSPVPGFIAWSRREPLSPIPTPFVQGPGPVPPQFLRPAISSQRLNLRAPRGHFFTPGQFNLTATVVPNFSRQPQNKRITLRRSKGQFQPSLVQGNQGVQFPLFTRQPSSRITLRRSQGRFFNPGQWNEVAPQLPSFPRQAPVRRDLLRRSQGVFFNQSWGQGNQGIQFPLFTRQPSPRITLRRSQGKFFSPGQFNLDGNPYTGFFRQSQRTRITLRRSQGKFFSQEWGQGNQGTQFPQFLQQEQTRRLTVRYPRGQFQFIPAPSPVTSVFTPPVNPIPGFIAIQRHLLDLFPAATFVQGVLPPQTAIPQFITRGAQRLPRTSRGRFASPGQFNLSGNPFPGFTRTASRPVPAKIRHGKYFDPGQFNEAAGNLPQFIRTPKRPVPPVRRGSVFRMPFTPSAPPQFMSIRRAKLSPPRRGKFQQQNIPQAVIPVWPPEFRTTHRFNFTKIRRGNIIKLVPFQLPTANTLSVTVKLGVPGTHWTTGGVKTNWKTGP